MELLAFIELFSSIVAKVDRDLSYLGPEAFFKHNGREVDERSCLAFMAQTRTQYLQIAEVLRENNVEFKSESFGNKVIIFFPKVLWSSVGDEICGRMGEVA